jgi:hypothetical protein
MNEVKKVPSTWDNLTKDVSWGNVAYGSPGGLFSIAPNALKGLGSALKDNPLQSKKKTDQETWNPSAPEQDYLGQSYDVNSGFNQWLKSTGNADKSMRGFETYQNELKAQAAQKEREKAYTGGDFLTALQQDVPQMFKKKTSPGTANYGAPSGGY